MTAYEEIHECRFKILLDAIDELKLPHSAMVLEVGCFPPILLNKLRRKFENVWGLASSHEPISGKQVVISNIETRKLPFKDNYFDLLICSEVIEHLTRDGKKIIAGLTKVLKPGGWLILTTPNVNSLKRLIQRIMGQETEVSRPGTSVYFSHNHEYSPRELQALMDSIPNLMTKGVQTISFYLPWRERVRRQVTGIQAIKRVILLLEKLIPAWRDSLLVICQKV